jgi:hypothetical protein
MRQFLIFFIVTFGLFNYTKGQTNEIEAQGVYKEIDIDRHNKAIEALTGKNKKTKQQTIDSILAKPNHYNPPVLYALSRELFKQDKKEKACFWFYTGQLRARYDANLCLDITAKQAVSILTQEYGPDINKYAFQNIDSLQKTVTKVVDFVRNNEEKYDHRWISLHGMGAVRAGLGDKSADEAIIEPQDKWAEVKMKTVDTYFNSFMDYIKKQKK